MQLSLEEISLEVSFNRILEILKEMPIKEIFDLIDTQELVLIVREYLRIQEMIYFLRFKMRIQGMQLDVVKD